MPDSPQTPLAGAPILSGNVPSEISLSGQSYIELRLPTSAFIASAPAAKEGSKP